MQTICNARSSVLVLSAADSNICAPYAVTTSCGIHFTIFAELDVVLDLCALLDSEFFEEPSVANYFHVFVDDEVELHSDSQWVVHLTSDGLSFAPNLSIRLFHRDNVIRIARLLSASSFRKTETVNIEKGASIRHILKNGGIVRTFPNPSPETVSFADWDLI